MSGSSRQLFFATVVVLLLVALGVWWYLGFSLDFMRFFAADPGVTDKTGQTCNAPVGCTCRVVVCVQAPCEPEIVCPSISPSTSSTTTSRRVVRCEPATQTVQVGAQATLTASDGSGVFEWFSPDGTPTSGGASAGQADSDRAASYRVAYSVPGTKKVTVQSARGTGSFTDSVACTVIVNTIVTTIGNPTNE